MKENGQFAGIIAELNELLEDASVPKNIKENIERVIKTLNEDGDPSVKVSKALNELDEVSNDINMQSYTRTQIWNIVSMLEKIIS
jgi:hypothetical protein